MNKKKYFNFYGKLGFLRGKRNYLHSTDIFEQIFYINRNSNLSDINIYFKKPIYNIPKIIIQSKYSEILRSKCFTYFEYKRNNKNCYGFIICSKIKIKNKKTYPEKMIQDKVIISKNKIKIPKIKNFNFIEVNVAAIMKYLKKISPEKKSKWLLGKISLNKFKFNNLFINKTYSININKISEIIYNFEILVKRKKVCTMIFMKK